MTLQDRVTQLLAKQARKNEGYKIFVNGEQVKVDTPLKSEDEVFASIEMLLADEAIRPSIRVEDPDGKVIMNQDTARVSSDDCDVTIAGYNDYDSDEDDEGNYCDEEQQKGVMDIILDALIDEDINYDSVGSGYDSQLHKNFVIVYLK
nr:MAG TPA: hypothetical protein [Caudoviricetes sp.]